MQWLITKMCVYYSQHSPWVWGWTKHEGSALSSHSGTQATSTCDFAMSRTPAFSAFSPPKGANHRGLPGRLPGARSESSVWLFCPHPIGWNSTIQPHLTARETENWSLNGCQEETEKWNLNGCQEEKKIGSDEHWAMSVTSLVVLSWGWLTGYVKIAPWSVLNTSSYKKILDQGCPSQEAVTICSLLGRVLNFNVVRNVRWIRYCFCPQAVHSLLKE